MQLGIIEEAQAIRENDDASPSVPIHLQLIAFRKEIEALQKQRTELFRINAVLDGTIQTQRGEIEQLREEKGENERKMKDITKASEALQQTFEQKQAESMKHWKADQDEKRMRRKEAEEWIEGFTKKLKRKDAKIAKLRHVVVQQRSKRRESHESGWWPWS